MSTTYMQTKWKGHIGALFSPMLRIFGSDDSVDEEEAQRVAEAAAAAAAEETARLEAIAREVCLC